MWPVMQGGTLFAPFVVALVIGLVKRDWFVSGVMVVVGIATWLGAQGVKRIVERERPIAFIADLHVREGTGNGLGYLSGHSAMAAAIVGVARIVHGVHLPADVIGGWAFGTLVGLVGVSVIDRHRRRAAPAPLP